VSATLPNVLRWKGPWSSSVDYVPGNLVSSDGSAYVCTSSSTNEEPPHAHWDSLAERGATWFSGHGVPTVVIGSKVGDYYFDEDSDLVYELE
jgi:hypothetical protein